MRIGLTEEFCVGKSELRGEPLPSPPQIPASALQHTPSCPPALAFPCYTLL